MQLLAIIAAVLVPTLNTTHTLDYHDCNGYYIPVYTGTVYVYICNTHTAIASAVVAAQNNNILVGDNENMVS